MPGLAALFAEFSARRALAALHEQLGAAGLAAATVIPGLSAAIDQHSAAVRDILSVGVSDSAGVAGVIPLAGYARGVLDHARASGWQPARTADLADWAGADWLTSRLLGVCALAKRPAGA